MVKHILLLRPKHELFYMKDLNKIILSYCQYSDAKKVFKMLRCGRPKKPVLSIHKYPDPEPDLDFTQYDRSPDLEKIAADFGSIEKVYIPYEPHPHFTLKDFLFTLMKLKVRIIWQCPSCSKYTEIKYNDQAEYSFRRNTYIQNYICDCRDRTGTVNYIIEIRRETNNYQALNEALKYHYKLSS